MMLASALRNVCLAILYVTVPAVLVLAFYWREKGILGEHERVPTGTWITLVVAAAVWTLVWVGLSAWAYQSYQVIHPSS